MVETHSFEIGIVFKASKIWYVNEKNLILKFSHFKFQKGKSTLLLLYKYLNLSLIQDTATWNLCNTMYYLMCLKNNELVIYLSKMLWLLKLFQLNNNSIDKI